MQPCKLSDKTRTVGGSSFKDLDIHDYKRDDGTPAMLSAWQPTAEELTALNRGEPVWLHILGNQHPPVILVVNTEGGE